MVPKGCPALTFMYGSHLRLGAAGRAGVGGDGAVLPSLPHLHICALPAAHRL